MDFLTSDTHFGHANIIKYCDRPFESVGHMNEEMVRNWNKRVGPSDTVYHLGDFAMGPKDLWPGYRKYLNGRIIFTVGNHDTPMRRFMEALLPEDEVHEQLTLPTAWGDISLAHAPVGWNEVRDSGTVTRLGGEVEADFFFCGHIHNAWRQKIINGYWCVNVGVDVWNFEPHTYLEILAECELLGRH